MPAGGRGTRAAPRRRSCGRPGRVTRAKAKQEADDEEDEDDLPPPIKLNANQVRVPPNVTLVVTDGMCGS
jgi:hypothetical protein